MWSVVRSYRRFIRSHSFSPDSIFANSMWVRAETADKDVSRSIPYALSGNSSAPQMSKEHFPNHQEVPRDNSTLRDRELFVITPFSEPHYIIVQGQTSLAAQKNP